MYSQERKESLNSPQFVFQNPNLFGSFTFHIYGQQFSPGLSGACLSNRLCVRNMTGR